MGSIGPGYPARVDIVGDAAPRLADAERDDYLRLIYWLLARAGGRLEVLDFDLYLVPDGVVLEATHRPDRQAVVYRIVDGPEKGRP